MRVQMYMPYILWIDNKDNFTAFSKWCSSGQETAQWWHEWKLG